MKIALIGYGKMGHMIEEIAKKRGHEIVSIIDINNKEEIGSEAFSMADVAIEFTVPGEAWENINKSWQAGVPVVSGTTGWKKKRGRDKRCNKQIRQCPIMVIQFLIRSKYLF